VTSHWGDRNRERSSTRMKVLSRMLVLWCMSACVPLNGQAQVGGTATAPGPIPGCSAAMCEDEGALITAIDAIIRSSDECREGAPGIYRSLHWAPYTSGTRAEETIVSRRGVPNSPAAMMVEHVLSDGLKRYWRSVRVVDSAAVVSDSLAASACLLVLSPPSWRGADEVRVEVAEWRRTPHHSAQRFVYLRRESGRWRVMRIETGMRS
jgi:hypothetical protein